jgi:hypothetical protein
VSPLSKDFYSEGLALENLSFHLPHPSISTTPDVDFYRIQLSTGTAEQCSAPISGLLHTTPHPTASFILIESDRDRPIWVTITNFAASGTAFTLDNNPATPIPDSVTVAGGHTLSISRVGTSTRIQLECARGSGVFPDGLIGLALSDPEGKRNFYDLSVSYNPWAFSTPDRLLQNPGWLKLILEHLWGTRDPMPVRFIPFLGYHDPTGLVFARGKVMPFEDLPNEGNLLSPEDRWLVLLPAGSAAMNLAVDTPSGADSFDISVELRNLQDQTLAVGQEVLGDDPLTAGSIAQARLAMASAPPNPVVRQYHLEADHLEGGFYFLKVTRPQVGGTFSMDFTFTRTPDLVLSPSFVDFGNRCLGSTIPLQWVTVSNAGQASLIVSNLNLAGPDADDFALENPPDLPVEIPPGGDLRISLSFQPSDLGPSQGELLIESNDPDNHSVRLGLSGVAQAEDTAPPQLSCPGDLEIWTCTNGVQVQYQVDVDDDCGTNVNLTCVPPPGSYFPLGTHTVVCTATDASDRSSQCQFIVRVMEDVDPPHIICPTNKTVNLMNTNGAVVFFIVQATDNADPNVSVTCTPPSGSWFPIGQTTVNCRAIDQCGNSTQCSFPVIVQEESTPSLNITREGDLVLISWPVPLVDCELQTTTNLDPPIVWSPVAEGPILTNGGFSVLFNITNETRFYRLIQRP